MAKKQYESPLAKLSRFENEDVITGSGWVEGAEGTGDGAQTYGSFDSSWLNPTGSK